MTTLPETLSDVEYRRINTFRWPPELVPYLTVSTGSMTECVNERPAWEAMPSWWRGVRVNTWIKRWEGGGLSLIQQGAGGLVGGFEDIGDARVVRVSL